MNGVTNDNEPAFDKFMIGYWNQMADEFYDSIKDAMDDFKATEGNQLYQRLLKDIVALYDAGRFPLRAKLRPAHRDRFWSKYDRIIVQEDLELAVSKWRHPS